MTHIRDDWSSRRAPDTSTGIALCGVENPGSSFSERHMREFGPDEAVRMAGGGLVLCGECRRLMLVVLEGKV